MSPHSDVFMVAEALQEVASALTFIGWVLVAFLFFKNMGERSK